MEYPWLPASATGVGSLPYDDRDEAARVVLGELPEFPHLPELPRRGAGTDLIGRSAVMLVDLHADLQPSGWRMVDRPGADERRARALLAGDLEAFEIAAYGYAGPLKVQVAGPLTLAAGLERASGDRLLADHGARRELAASLAEGVAAHVADLRRRVPGADIVVQVDEPGLPSVLAGEIPTISGYGRLRAVDPTEAESHLATLVSAAQAPVVVHSCAADPPSSLFRRAGAVAVSLDVGRLTESGLRDLAAAVDAGLAVWPGVVASVEPVDSSSERELAERVERLWRRLDQDPAAMAARTVVTPTCGLAGAEVPWARRAYALARSTGRAFTDIVGAER